MNPKFKVYIKSISIDDINYDDEFTPSLIGGIWPVIGLRWDRKLISIDVADDCNPGLFDWNDNVILVQYTGLNDKNGQEIYEGDILKFSPPPDKDSDVNFGPILKDMFMAVKFDKGSFCLEMPWSETKSLFDYRFTIHNFEISGTVYKNPELLKSKDTECQSNNSNNSETNLNQS
jgi:uncharacterized phage protein (TIGR01671 family)